MQNSKIEKEKYIIVDWLSRLGVEFQTGFVVINSQLDEQPILYANQAFYDMTNAVPTTAKKDRLPRLRTMSRSATVASATSRSGKRSDMLRSNRLDSDSSTSG